MKRTAKGMNGDEFEIKT